MSARSKELAIQNARLSELEKLIAKSTSIQMGRGIDFRSSEEYNNLQEENRVVRVDGGLLLYFSIENNIYISHLALNFAAN